MIESMLQVSCVYEIVNRIHGRRYIGSTSNFRRRMLQHRFHLRRGTHENPHLQAAWKKHGEDAFDFKMVEIVPLGRLIEQEQALLDACQPYVYNTGRVAATPMLGRKSASRGMTGKRHSEQTLSKMSASRKTVWETLRQNLPTHCKKGHEYTAENVYLWRGKRFCITCRRAIYLVQGRRQKTGWQHSETTKARMRATWARRKALKVEVA